VGFTPLFQSDIPGIFKRIAIEKKLLVKKKEERKFYLP